MGGSADDLLGEALQIPFDGWDFSRLGDRILIEPPPWQFGAIVEDAARTSATMLDMGTGGGEFLSSLQHRPPRTVATESWAPNVPVAAARLAPLGVAVVRDEGAPDNVAQEAGAGGGRLAFRSRAFDLVLSRHEAFVAGEVFRVLRPGGSFVTQQASSGSRVFHGLLGMLPRDDAEFHVELAVEQLNAAGFMVERAEAGTATTVFADIGALAWYLHNTPWAVPGFSIDEHRTRLVELHGAPTEVTSERFLVIARRTG